MISKYLIQLQFSYLLVISETLELDNFCTVPYKKQRHNCGTLRNNLSNGVLIVKNGYALTDLQAIKD